MPLCILGGMGKKSLQGCVGCHVCLPAIATPCLESTGRYVCRSYIGRAWLPVIFIARSSRCRILLHGMSRWHGFILHRCLRTTRTQRHSWALLRRRRDSLDIYTSLHLAGRTRTLQVIILDHLCQYISLVLGRGPRLADRIQVSYALARAVNGRLAHLVGAVPDSREEMRRACCEGNVEEGGRGEAESEAGVVDGEERVDACCRSIASLLHQFPRHGMASEL